MSSQRDACQRRADEAKQRAAQATEPFMKSAYETVAPTRAIAHNAEEIRRRICCGGFPELINFGGICICVYYSPTCGRSMKPVRSCWTFKRHFELRAMSVPRLGDGCPRRPLKARKTMLISMRLTACRLLQSDTWILRPIYRPHRGNIDRLFAKHPNSSWISTL